MEILVRGWKHELHLAPENTHFVRVVPCFSENGEKSIIVALLTETVSLTAHTTRAFNHRYENREKALVI